MSSPALAEPAPAPEQAREAAHYGYRRIWELAWPVAISTSTVTLLTLVNLLWIGHLGTVAIAAVSLCSHILFIVFGLSQIVHAGAIAIVALAACSDSNGGDDGDTLSVPSNLVVEAISSTDMEITFNAVSGATGYILQRAEGTSGTYTEVAQPSTTDYTDTGLNPNTTYSYRVAAIAPDPANNSGFSAPQAAQTLA